MRTSSMVPLLAPSDDIGLSCPSPIAVGCAPTADVIECERVVLVLLTTSVPKDGDVIACEIVPTTSVSKDGDGFECMREIVLFL